MKYSKLNEAERKWIANEMCKVRQKLHVGFTKTFTNLETELMDYMALYESLQNMKKKICDKYFEHK